MLNFKMNFEYEKIKRVLKILFLILIASGVVRVVVAMSDAASLETEAQSAAEKFDKLSQDSEECIKEYSEELMKLNENGIFYVAKPKPQPPRCAGILGESALLNNQWCKVGENKCGAKLVRIEPTYIVIEWEGKEMELSPLLASNGGSRNAKRIEGNKESEKKTGGQAKVVKATVEEVAVSTGGEDPLAWMGVELTAQQRECLLKYWGLLSDEEKEVQKQQWQNLSEDQKQNMLNEMQEAIDSGEFEEVYQREKARRGK